MRIHELAKKYDVTSDELIGLLKKAGYDISNHMSSIDYDMLTALDRHFSWSESVKTKKKTRARKTTTRKKADEADDAVPKTVAKVKAKTKLRKAKPVEPEPVAVPEVEETKIAAKSKAKTTAEPAKTPAAAEVSAAAESKVAETRAVEKPAARPAAKVEAKTPPAAAKSAAPVKAPRAEKVAPTSKAAKPESTVAAPKVTTTAVEADHKTKKSRGKGKKSPVEQEAQDRAVRESVRRTLAKLETTRKTKRRKTRSDIDAQDLPAVPVQERSTVAMLASALGITVQEMIQSCAELGLEVTATTELDRETIEMVGEEVGRIVDIEAEYGETKLKEEAQIDPAKLVARAPVVTVMGHVDHGKTSILDYIRKARVAAGEAGGITQHIGAYEVSTPQGHITFIDTPGHEAFTEMRSRGATITDIVVLVVAADDGVMPQTIEAISHTRAAGVPMIVAVNKIDLPSANPQNIKQQLMQYEVVVEAYGGEVVEVELSAKTGVGVDKLLEMILLQAELLELKADPTARAQGVVVEVKKEEGRGILVTVLIQQGTLKAGDVFVMGDEYGKVRSLVDYNGKSIKQAGPAQPVLVLGANGIPEPGDTLIAVKNEREAREISGKRQDTSRARDLQPAKTLTLEQLYEQIQDGGLKELNLIIKADTNGVVEALCDKLQTIEILGIKVKVLHSAVGTVSESDVLLAQSSGAIIIAFHTKVSPRAKELGREKGVDIRRYDIIYEVIESVELAMQGMLEPEFIERVVGRAEVRKLFRVSKLGTIAGSMVVEGSIPRSASARVRRGDEIIFQGRIASLKRFQEDTREVLENFECGIGLAGFDDLVEGDIIEAFVVEEKVRVF